MSNSVAEASIILSVDATRLNAGLNKAAKDSKAKGSEIAKSFKDSGKEKLGEVFGGGSILGMGAKAGVIGAAISAVAFAGKELYDELIVNSKEYGRELEANERAVSQWADKQRDSFDSIKESLTEFGSVMGTTEGIKANEKALDSMRAKLEGIAATKKATADEEKSYDSKWDSTRNFQLWMSSKLEDKQKSAANNTKTQTQLEDELRKKFEDQQKVLSRLQNPLTNPEARAALGDFIRGTEDAMAALDGRTAKEQELINLQRKYGFKGADLAGAQAAANTLKLAEANKEATEWVRDLNNGLLEQAGVIKDTAGLVKLDELIKKGADENQIDRIRQLMRAKQTLNQQYQPLQALERGTSAENGFRKKLEFDQAKQAEAIKLVGKEQIDLLKAIRDGVTKSEPELTL